MLGLTARVVLAALLCVVVWGGRIFPLRSRAAWLLVALVYTVVGCDYALVELLNLTQVILPEASGLEPFRRWIYYCAYLLNGLLFAALPSVLVGLCGGSAGLRLSFSALAGVAAAVAVIGAASGALRDWDALLSWTPILSFIGIVGYLSFGALALLGRLPQADSYLVGFVAIGAVFELLVPIQEAFFRLVGREGSSEIWELLQLLQVVTAVAQIVVVLALLNSLRRTSEQGLVPPLTGVR